MPIRETEAFILKTYKLGEYDKIAVAFTRELGKIKVVAKGARSSRARYGASLEPFTKVALSFYQREGRELYYLRTCEILRSSFSIAADPQTLGELSYAAELIEEFLPAAEANRILYRLLDVILELFDSASDASLLLRYFEIWVLKLSGFFPDLGHCSSCHRALPSTANSWIGLDGSSYCVQCRAAGSEQVTLETKRMIGEILKTHPGEFTRDQADEAALRSLGVLNRRLIRHHLERDLKTNVDPLRHQF